MVLCLCGRPARLQPNSLKYGRSYGNGWGWFCAGWDDGSCQGYVGTHPDHHPLGRPCDGPTHRARMACHDRIDPLWKEQGYPRGRVYAWLAELMHTDHVHIGELDLDGCDELLTLIRGHPFDGQKD
jgi:hypothetical protein